MKRLDGVKEVALKSYLDPAFVTMEAGKILDPEIVSEALGRIGPHGSAFGVKEFKELEPVSDD